jgi:signal transduction histidine kinase
MTQVRGRHGGVAAGGAVALSAAIALVTVSWIALRPRGGLSGADAIADLTIAVAATTFAVAGSWIVRRVGNRIGLVFSATGVGAAITALCDAVLKGTTHSPAPGWLVWFELLAIVGPLIVVGALSILFLLFPTGEIPGARWRWVPRLWAVGLVSALVATLFAPGPVSGDVPGVVNPLGIAGLRSVCAALAPLAGIALLGVVLLGVASLVVRSRGGSPEVRAQVRWLTFAGAIGVVSFLLSGIGGGNGAIANASWVLFLATVIVGIPAAVAIAVLKYHLYDIDVVVSKTIVYGTLVAFTTLVYVATVLVVGRAIGVGSTSIPLSITATAVVAVAFQPLRERLQRLANRVVYGKRATPYEVLARFSARVGEAYATEDLLPRTARVLAEGVHAARAVVWLRLGERFEPSAAWPPQARHGLEPVPVAADGAAPSLPGDHVAPVRYQDQLLGALAVEKPRDEPIAPDEVELLDDLASQAGLVLSNVRMTADLEARLALIEEQAEALKASRQRIVAAQDAERRRLERNIHDGAQQHLVALAVKLRLAQGLVAKDPEHARAILTRLRDEVDEALNTLRTLSLGIYPPLLEEHGIAAALAAQQVRSDLPVLIHADGLGRHAIEVEAAVYFCVGEALQNAAKYASASTIDVMLADRDGMLTFEVRDDGVGFDPSTNGHGTGLAGMRDRLAVLGGDVVLASSPSEGTVVRGRVPLGVAEMAT